jgi:hypothetical protein
VITGVGKYGLGKGEFSEGDSAIGSMLRALGSHFGGSALGELGSSAGNWLSKLVGLGAYSIESNTVLQGLNGAQVPVMHSTNDSVVVRHREFVGVVHSTDVFENISYDINPGNRSLFPWLCTLAANYRMWKMRGAVFEYHSTASLMSASANAGAVMMTTNYNVYDPAFDSSMQVLNNTFTTSAKPFETFVHPLECAGQLEPTKWLFIRNHSAPVNQDQRLYDMGKFQVAVEGCPSAGNGAAIGQLWVTYEVELAKPIMYGSLGLDTPLYQLKTAGTAASGATTLVVDYPFSTVGANIVGINDFSIYRDPSTGYSYLPPGNFGLYQIEIVINTSSTTLGVPSYSSTSNLTFVPTYPNTSGGYTETSYQTYSTIKSVYKAYFKVNDVTLKSRLPVMTVTVSTSATYAVLVTLSQVSYNIFNLAYGQPIVSQGRKEIKRQVQVSEEKVDDVTSGIELLELKEEPKPPDTYRNTVLRSLGMSKSTLDVPALKHT